MARTTLGMIRGARERGLDVTTEAYPYTAGSTLIQSALFDSWEGLDDSTYARLQWGGTTERLTAATFRRYRDQGGWVVIHGRNEETNEWIVAQPDVIVASDGIPFEYVATHPRGAGTYARVLGYYARERGESARQGHAPGMYNLALLLLSGRGVAAPDPPRARRWLERAASRRHRGASNLLAELNAG